MPSAVRSRSPIYFQRKKRSSPHRCSTQIVVGSVLTLAGLAVSGSLLLSLQVYNNNSSSSRSEENHNPTESMSFQQRISSSLLRPDSSRSLSVSLSESLERPTPTITAPRLQPITNATSSSCMLIMDDNHWLVEWRKCIHNSM
jgi:hypothetical protein